MEIGENFDLKSNPSQTEVNQILEKIERKGILKRIRFKSEEEKYLVVEK
jgi:DNA-binding Lrp family transcriptional regulator